MIWEVDAGFAEDGDLPLASSIQHPVLYDYNGVDETHRPLQ